MSEPVHAIDVQTMTGWVRLTVTPWQALTIERQLHAALEPEYLRLAVHAPDEIPDLDPIPVRLRLVDPHPPTEH